MTAPDQPSLGTLLRQRREQRGMTLETVSRQTRIKLAYLQALEEDRFEVFPGEVYLSGFLRTYAASLGLEAGSLLERYRQQTGNRQDKGEQALAGELTSIPIESSSPSRPLVRLLLAALVVLATLVGALLFKDSLPQEPAEVIQPLAASDAPGGDSPGPALPQAVPEPAAPEAQQPAAEEAQQPASEEREYPGPGEPERATEETSVALVEPVPAAEPAPIVKTGAPPQAPVQPLAQLNPGGAAMKVEALAPVSIGISVDGQAERRYELAAATVLSWKVRSSARLSVSDPAALRVWLNQERVELEDRSELVLNISPGSLNEDGQ
ncbi:hypothetical protein DESUT3_26230 [Desulfuromonas versatilis]|uniref:HTH cro/C1-type domain-containing protein n=1 Tax=Desulfuromonas versatilis TaxID=2802975 RepID=A0ABN6E222_9BACT|nr:helix-turn-helix domain-containing protein [Desulfuromonas versatilis]BCR05554.1 hypothetical protein DESUT3_26230 [Desulfuromonas versatilis]